jgi:circadian clock protein KaiC
MSERRVSTGVEGLDKIIGGGFPSGSLILLAGNPGTGKTVFSARFLYHGAVNNDENGIYVNFSENRETFYENMRSFGFDFKTLEKEERFRYLGMQAVREATVSSIMKVILEGICEIRAKRLVIDSFSTIAQAFERPHDARILIQTVLDRIVRRLECTTLMIVEVPYGGKMAGLGIEEFVADGFMLFRAGRLEERLFRDISIKKMRGTVVSEDSIGFTIDGGFRAFSPFEAKPINKRKNFQPIPDPPDMFSTGSEDLDRLLEGGYPRGSTVLLEIGKNVSTQQYHMILSPTPWNFLAKEAGVMVLPSSGVDHNIVWRRAAESGLPEEKLRRLLKVCIFRYLTAKREPYMLELEGRDLNEDLRKFHEAAAELTMETSKPPLLIIGVDSLIAQYDMESAIKILNIGATMIRESGSLGIFLLKPGHREASDILNAVVDVHLKIIREHGALLLYGLKPRTSLHFVEMDVSKGYPLPKLSPVL